MNYMKKSLAYLEKLRDARLKNNSPTENSRISK